MSMLVPAATRKEEIIRKFQEKFYTDDMMFYNGWLDNHSPDIVDNPSEGIYQFAIVDKRNNLLGYLAYYIDWYSSQAYNFGAFSFDKGNIIVGEALFSEMEKLINDYKLHRIEWRMLGGNPVEKNYDNFCKRYNGTKHILKDVVRDKYGKYHDSIIYEILQ